MRLTTDYEPIYRRVQRGHDVAVDGTLQAHRSAAPRRKGEYAASLQRAGSGLTATVGSTLPRAGAMRSGANVGARRGPHHGPVDTFDDGQEYIKRMPAALRGA